MNQEAIPTRIDNKPSEQLKRKKWQNCVCNQVIEPLLYLQPQTLAELIGMVQDAEREGCKIKAVGSGHSFSDIVQTSDFLVDCHSLNKPIDLKADLLYDEATLEERSYALKHLVHVENGITIKALNEYLDKINLGLLNMGGYDGQTIVGAIVTSTHGSGITLGPIAASVVSIIMVDGDGAVYRIEPSLGITDPVKYKSAYPENILKQDDDFFNATLISMGCMGIFYSVILKVTDSYYLEEKREGSKGETFWEDLKQGDTIQRLLRENRHLEIWVNPYEIKGRHNCLVTKRNIYTGEIKKLPFWKRSRNWLVENVILKFKTLPKLGFRFLYKWTPQLISASMNAVLDYNGYIDKSYHVLNIGNANYVKGYSGEYAISLRDGMYIKAVDTILALAKKNREVGQIFHTAPISMRFVKQCDAYLSMMHGEDKCMIEAPLLVGTKGRFQILDKIEHELFKLDKVRPHWGQYHNLGEDTIRLMYPRLDDWLRVYKKMNSSGIFKNTFTDRCGFDDHDHD